MHPCAYGISGLADVRRWYVRIAEAYAHLHVNFGAFPASDEIGAEPLILLIFLDSCDVKRFRIENQTVIITWLDR